MLPLIGAGTSIDCGQELASDVSEEMFKRLAATHGTSSLTDLADSKDDMGLVADALFIKGGQESVIDALGLSEESSWPELDGYPEHFCTYRVLARLAREGYLSEAISLNYDCGFERGLDDEGFHFEPWTLHGREWLDHATVVTGASTHFQLDKRGEMVLTKAHGCASAYRREISAEPNEEEVDRIREGVIVRRGQLLDWRDDFWARDLFADRARRHVILLLGMSGQDPVIQIALTRVLEEVYERLGEQPNPCTQPRVVVVDRKPDTVALAGLAHIGCGRQPAGSQAVTKLQVPKDASMTAVLLALAAEMLAHRLESEGSLSLPSDREKKLVALMVAVPASLRWAFHLERRTRGAEFYQRASLERAKEKGYVPLGAAPMRAAESLRVREALRQRLEMKAAETLDEAVDGKGFVVSPRHGKAYLPLGVSRAELGAIPKADLAQPWKTFPTPAELDLVLVAADGTDLIGRSVQTGRGVVI